MMKKNYFFPGIFIVATLLVLSAGSGFSVAREQVEKGDSLYRVPLYSNAYVNNLRSRWALHPTDGTGRWTSDTTVYSVYVNVRGHGELRLALRGCSGGGAGRPNTLNVKVYVNDVLATAAGRPYDRDYAYGKEDPSVDTLSLHRLLLPEVKPGHAGNMLRVDLRAVGERNGDYYFRFPELLLSGEATRGVGGAGLNFVPPSNAHFGRRGPSVHVRPDKPDGDMEYFYSEVFIPGGQDVLGSYFMCNGFGEGYAGIQVNSERERRVLFSVWSAYSTDNPSLMGKYAPRLVRVNNQPGYRPAITYTKFGGEGSGGQSYLRHAWQAGKTYKMLTRVRPHPRQDKYPNSSLYKAWFHDGAGWIFIAEWRRIELDAADNNGRPPRARWYTGAHHFLENFNPAVGNLARRGTWDNQWYISKDGEFFEPTGYLFTNDATASAGHRVDYAGGVMPAGDERAGAIFLKMGGYFTANVSARARFTKPAKNNRPALDFAALNAMGTDDPAADPVIDPGERYDE
jgi:hypothetical protein